MRAAKSRNLDTGDAATQSSEPKKHRKTINSNHWCRIEDSNLHAGEGTSKVSRVPNPRMADSYSCGIAIQHTVHAITPCKPPGSSITLYTRTNHKVSTILGGRAESRADPALRPVTAAMGIAVYKHIILALAVWMFRRPDLARKQIFGGVCFPSTLQS